MMEFMRKHHMLGALFLLSAAIVSYFVGYAAGAVALIGAAAALEISGWYLVLTRSSKRSSTRRDHSRE